MLFIWFFDNHADAIGSVRSLTDEGAGQVGTYAYDAWGNVTAETGSEGNEYKFTSRRWDSAVGLQYNRARFYDPQIGRFISPDPLTGGPDDPRNLYSSSAYKYFSIMIDDLISLYLKLLIDSDISVPSAKNYFELIKPEVINDIKISKELAISLDSYSKNAYIYCSNNPINIIDPLGLDDIVILPKGNLDRSEAAAIAYWNQEANSRGPNDVQIKCIYAYDYDDAITQLRGERRIDSLTFAPHGSPGRQMVGPLNGLSRSVFSADFGKYDAVDLAGLDFKEEAIIKFDGCHVGYGQEGKEFVEAVAAATRRTVIAYAGPTFITPSEGGEYVKINTGVCVTVEPEKQKDKASFNEQQSNL